MEQSRETKLVKNTIIYTISNFGSKILTFLMVPLYTFYLSTAEFGTYDTVISIVNLLAPMCVLAIHEGLLRWLLKSDEKHEEILGSGLSLLFLFVGVTDILVYIVCKLLSWEYTFVFIILMTATALHTSFQFVARGEKRNKVFAISGVIYTIVMLALNVLFIVYFRWGVNGMLWSMAIAHICVIIYLLWMLRDRLQFKQMRFKKELAIAMLSYSIMLVPNNISWWVMNASDRIMLTAMVGAATTGIFSLAHKFPSIVTILHTLFYQAWQEQAVLEYDSASRDSYYTKVFNHYMRLVCCAVAVLIPLSKLLIMYCMDRSYMDSFQYVGLLYLGSLFSSFSGFYGTGYISAKDTKGAMKTTIIGAVINFLVNLFLIPVIGIWAACLSTVCGNLIVWIIRIKNTRKYFHISVEWKTFAVIMFVNVLFTIAVCFTDTAWTIVMLIVACVVAVLMNKGMIVGILNNNKKKGWNFTVKKQYDYLIVGSGLYGAIFAHEAKAHGKTVLVVDKRPNIAGNIYTENIEGINVHKYGAHIFHTNNKKVWNYITQFAEFNRFTNSPVANYKGELYSLPFNMYTFNKMWGVVTPEEAVAKIEEQRKEITCEPRNLEEQAISLVGRDIYEKLIKGYTEKQWGRDCKDLPSFIIKRLPVRLTFDNNYFNALYQGIPVGGYTRMIANLLEGIEVRLNTDYLEHRAELDALADQIVYTGPIDAYFDYKLGALEYRSVRFENELLDKPNFQGNAAVNYTDRDTPWTRIIEHKWFEFGKDENGNALPKTIISREYSSEWKPGDEPYYPVNDEKNGELYQKYKELADREEKVIFGGRLGEYKYYDMDATIASVLDKVGEVLG